MGFLLKEVRGPLMITSNAIDPTFKWKIIKVSVHPFNKSVTYAHAYTYSHTLLSLFS